MYSSTVEKVTGAAESKRGPWSWLRGAFHSLEARRQERLAIEELHAWSDAGLADIGLSRSEIESAVTGRLSDRSRRHR